VALNPQLTEVKTRFVYFINENKSTKKVRKWQMNFIA